MLCLLYMFIDLYTCYTSHLLPDESLLVLDEVGVDQGSMVYPLIIVLHSSPPLYPLPPLPLLLLPPSPDHPPHTQEFVIIPNPGYVKPRSQQSFPLHPFSSPTPHLGHEDCTSPISSFTPSPTPNQPSFKVPRPHHPPLIGLHELVCGALI